MRTTVILLAVACGCGPMTTASRDDTALLCECFAAAAYDAVRAEMATPEAEQSCCGKCNGTGKVRSGDGLSIVPCPCPPTCKCKGGKK